MASSLSPLISFSYLHSFRVPTRLHQRISVKRPIRFHEFRSSHIFDLSTQSSRFVPYSCSESDSSMPIVADDNSSVLIKSSVPQDSLTYSRAFWVCKSLIAWNISVRDTSVFLYASKGANLYLTDDGIRGYEVRVRLDRNNCGLPNHVKQKFPHISSYTAFKIPDSVEIANLIKCQLIVASFDDDRCSNVTGLQLAGVIDDLYAYTGPLGAIFSKESLSLYLWAPTAQEVQVYIYEDTLVEDPMECIKLEEIKGVWCVTGPSNWEGCYYVYEVSSYHPSTSRIETCTVNDPYARGLSPNGKRTLLVNLDHNYLKPSGWDMLADKKPILSSFSDISIYELHIRDFSASDYTVNEDFRGGYLAFTCQDSNGIRHLRRLCQAGITHVHLLPSFHFGCVDDEKNKWSDIDPVVLAKLPSDSEEQQAQVVAIHDTDGYNWGYNPILWGVPKGSYANNPNGPNRTLEFRKMIQALNHMGLRVVLDVVYNHVYGSGPTSDDSVLDKAVPGYYLRRNIDGFVENSACTNNTESEHFMVERLIIDDLLCWAVQYKVDGFRFDLMGHIMKSTMMKAKSALHSLSKDRDGVDGSKLYIYGEGWDFGEVANNKRGVNASQLNLSGSGIGSFNDRMRDAILGGSPFGNPLQQGFVTGLSLQPNGYDHGNQAVVDNMLATSADHIKVGLAANLWNFVFTGNSGEAIQGSEVITYGGSQVGYARCPSETVNYVSAHDNETLFDIISLKTPIEISVEERCRINHVATSMIALSQGIPFFHAGDEILRSKSLDRDSYNSGDWFNRIDFSYESNNWGIGLPPREKNEKSWPLMKPRLADPSFKPSKSLILGTLENFEDFLRIRYSSPLFRLRTENSIQERVCFHNCGPSYIPGVICMSIEDGHKGIPGLAQLDDRYSCIVIIINSRPTEVKFTIQSFRARTFQLHPIQLKSADKLTQSSVYRPASGCFIVPHRTTSVFVEVRPT